LPPPACLFHRKLPSIFVSAHCPRLANTTDWPGNDEPVANSASCLSDGARFWEAHGKDVLTRQAVMDHGQTGAGYLSRNSRVLRNSASIFLVCSVAAESNTASAISSDKSVSENSRLRTKSRNRAPGATLRTAMKKRQPGGKKTGPAINDFVLAELGLTCKPDPVLAVWKPLEEPGVGLRNPINPFGQFPHLATLGAGELNGAHCGASPGWVRSIGSSAIALSAAMIAGIWA